MTKFNAIQFAAGASVDVNQEIDELVEMLEQGTEAACEIQNRYRHLSSLIQGLDYTLDYLADDETKDELKEIVKGLNDMLDGYWHRCASIVWTKRFGKEVRITVAYHINGHKTFNMYFNGAEEATLIDATRDQIVDHLRNLEK